MARKQRAGGAAAAVAARVNAQMKSNVVMLGSDPRFRIKRVPTGILTIDRLLRGGFARGRHVELYGDWHAGKSLVSYKTMVLAQQRGEVCAVVDGEHVFDAPFFSSLGGNPKDLLMYWPANANELGDVLRLFLQDDDEVKGVDIVSVDSVASMVPQEELEQGFVEDGSKQYPVLAMLMSSLLRKLTTENDDTLFLWTNQWRDKIGRIPGLKSTPGGNALGFYASTRLEMLLADRETEDRETVHHGKVSKRKMRTGRWVDLRITKDKTGAQPDTTAAFLFDYENRRINEAQEIIDLGLADGIIEKKGDYYHYENIKAHGLKQMRKKIDGDEDLYAELVVQIEERTAALAEEDDG